MKALTLISIFVFVINLHAQWSSDSTINNPICTAFNYQKNPQLIDDGSSGSIIVWEDNRNGYYDIYSQRINSSGHLLWANDGITVSSATDDQTTPEIVSDDNGGAIIVWQDNRNGNADIYVQRINNNGASQWTADGIPICTVTNAQFEPQIINDGNGGAIITWKDYRSGLGYDIYAQRVDANGNTLWTTDGIVICSAVNEQSYQQIINDSNGGAIIVWQDERSGAFDIYAQRIDTSGNVLWVNDGVRICTEANDQQNCQLTSDEMGGAFIVWRDIRNATNWDIYCQRINQDGSRMWDTSGVAVCIATADQFFPQIAGDLNGGAIICWEDYRSGVINSDIFAQRVDENGNILWNVNGVEICTADYVQKKPDIISDETGGVIIVWQDHRRQYEDDIYAQRINSNGNVLWTLNGVTISVPTLDQILPQLIFTKNNNAIITWQDFQNGNYDIYASLVDTSGRLGGTAVYVDGDENHPNSFNLFQNYPNPFNPSTSIQYAVSSRQFVSLKIYDVLGKEIETLVNEEKPAGRYEVEFNVAQDSRPAIASGIYFYQLKVFDPESGSGQVFVQTKKMILIR